MTDIEIATQLAVIQEKVIAVADDVTEVKTLAKATNGRVTKLEASRERDKGFLAAIALLMPVATAVISAWLITVLF